MLLGLSFTLLFLSIPIVVFSQGNTDIFLIKMKMEKGNYVFTDPVKVNPTEGYNNQPSFHPDGGSLFYSSGSGPNTDIYRYDIQGRKNFRLTDTPDSEYSPTVMPGATHFSVIQLVISEGPRTGAQPLLSFPLEGGTPELIYENGDKVGYHAWIDAQKVALFLLGSPNFLKIVDLKDGSSVRIAENIGRSLYKIPGKEAISFSHSTEGQPDVIMMYDLQSRTTESLVPMLEGNEFYAWTSSGVLVMGVGAKLCAFESGQDEEWRQIGDLELLGITNISRLAVQPQMDYIAFVNSH
jgi:hypothetical protein